MIDRRAASAALLAAALVSLSAAGASAGTNPHAFMSDQSRCKGCHSDSPVRPGGRFVRDIVTLCSDCHSTSHRMSHPVDVRPSRAPSPSLPLDADGAMTCVTCHDPHASPYDETPRVHSGLVESLRQAFSGEGYRTYFLRAPSLDGMLCLSCHGRDDFGRDLLSAQEPAAGRYAGSDACRGCHEQIHALWSDTSHARTLRDPREDPDAVLARFSGAETFRREDVVFAIGTHYSQRYVVDRGGELMVAKGVWQIGEGRWGRSYWKEQPWRELCAGCHLTGYDPFQGTVVEPGVGCEMCHGPGARHARTGDRGDIVNPARLDGTRRDSICASCHTHGHDRTGQYRYPAGYTPGQDLATFYRGLTPCVGQGPESFRGDGTIEDRLRSYRYWADNFFRHDRFTCKLCKDFTGETAAAPDGTAGAPGHHCAECHPASSLEGAQHRSEAGAAEYCVHCHSPMAARDGRPSIHDHKFIFPAP